MAFKNSFSIFVNKYNLIFKSIIYFAIVYLAISSIAISLLSPMFKRVREEIKQTQIVETIKDATTQFLKGDPEYETTLQKLNIDWQKVKESFNDTNLVLAVVVLVLFYLLICFFTYLSYYTSADIINEYMQNYAKYGFLSNLISNLGKSSLYSLLFLAISIPFTALMIFGGYYLFIGLSKLLSFLVAIPILLIFLMLVSALHNTLLCCWLPAMTKEKLGIIKAINQAFTTVKPVFWSTFGLFTMINFLAVVWTYLCVVSTFGAGFIIAIPSVIIFKRVAEHVVYYNIKGYNYYVDKDRVVQGSID